MGKIRTRHPGIQRPGSERAGLPGADQRTGEREHLAEYAHKLTYIPIVTREQHPGALSRRITTLIKNGKLERTAGLKLTPEHSRVLICGNPQMVDDTRQLLKQRDMQLSLSRRPGQVAVENYW